MAMVPEADPADLIRREPDERLLGEDLPALPESAGAPAPLRQVAARRLIVGAGATLTAVSLLVGIVLSVVGVASTVAGGLHALSAAELAVGLVLMATHWGWVHVAEAAAGSVQQRGNRDAASRRREWLHSIEPYPRLSVQTEAAPDGAITILTLRHRPVPSGSHSFTFAREILAREVHPGSDPAAAVSERAELLRRRAAAVTASERERFETVRDALAHSTLTREDECQRRAALRAESQALSEQINANLRDEPLDG